MALAEINKIDQIEITENNIIQIRTVTIIEKDGVEISRSNFRHTLTPGEDIYNEDLKVQSIANAIWTEEVIATFQQMQVTALKNK
jgi:hypothetical protein